MLKIFRYFVQMSSLSKTYSYAFILLATIFCSLFASGQTITKNKSRKKHPTTIGFQTGKDVILSPTYNKPIKVNFGVNNNLFLRKKLKPHFQLESGLNYDRSQNPIYKYSSADASFKQLNATIWRRIDTCYFTILLSTRKIKVTSILRCWFPIQP